MTSGYANSLDSVVIANDKEIRALKASIDQKNRSIDAILKDFQFTLD